MCVLRHSFLEACIESIEVFVTGSMIGEYYTSNVGSTKKSEPEYGPSRVSRGIANIAFEGAKVQTSMAV
jgi:hypothetical protein